MRLRHKNNQETNNTQDVVFPRAQKAKRWSELMLSLAWTNSIIACLIDSNLVKGRPFGPFTFISTIVSGPTSMQKSMSSFEIRTAGSVYPPSPCAAGDWEPTCGAFVLRASATSIFAVSIFSVSIDFGFQLGFRHKNCRGDFVILKFCGRHGAFPNFRLREILSTSIYTNIFSQRVICNAKPLARLIILGSVW